MNTNSNAIVTTVKKKRAQPPLPWASIQKGVFWMSLKLLSYYWLAIYIAKADQEKNKIILHRKSKVLLIYVLFTIHGGNEILKALSFSLWSSGSAEAAQKIVADVRAFLSAKEKWPNYGKQDVFVLGSSRKGAGRAIAGPCPAFVCFVCLVLDSVLLSV